MKNNRYILDGKTANQWAKEIGISLTALLKRIEQNDGVFDHTCTESRIFPNRGIKSNANQNK